MGSCCHSCGRKTIVSAKSWVVLEFPWHPFGKQFRIRVVQIQGPEKYVWLHEMTSSYCLPHYWVILLKSFPYICIFKENSPVSMVLFYCSNDPQFYLSLSVFSPMLQAFLSYPTRFSCFCPPHSIHTYLFIFPLLMRYICPPYPFTLYLNSWVSQIIS